MFPVQRAAVSEVIGRCKSIAGILLIIQIREILGMGNCSILSMIATSSPSGSGTFPRQQTTNMQ